MSHNALNQPLMSQSLGGHNGNQQVMVTGAQVMQFLSTTVSQGGGNSVMAQDVLQLMQQQPTAIVDDITRQMAPVVQLIAPRENQVTSALDRVCVQYQPQIAQQQSARSGQVACTALAKMLSGMPAAQTPEGRLLVRQLQQGRLPEDNATKRQLGQLLEQARGQDASGQMTQLLKQLAKAVPGSQDLVQKALVGEEHRRRDDEQVATSAKEKNNIFELPRQQEGKQGTEDIAFPIGQRQGGAAAGWLTATKCCL